jgi:hypothetical protein
MEISREEFKILVKGMKAVYTQAAFIPDNDAFSVWYEMLKDIPYKNLSTAIQRHIMTNRFPPTIADIRDASMLISDGDGVVSELEAWSMVRKALRNSCYHAEDEFDRLPTAVQIAVGNPANLREWACMPTDTVESVEQSHFIRAYRAAVEDQKDIDRLAPEVKKVYSLDSNHKTERIESAASVNSHNESENYKPMPEHIRQKMMEMASKWGAK